MKPFIFCFIVFIGLLTIGILDAPREISISSELLLQAKPGDLLVRTPHRIQLVTNNDGQLNDGRISVKSFGLPINAIPIGYLAPRVTQLIKQDDPQHCRFLKQYVSS
ncbi:MAG: hypothetical protein V3T98_00580 [Candidatus Paceibacterota bacterium]